MTTRQTNRVLTYLHRLARLEKRGEMTDAQLLESFILRRDEPAFEELVRRHGPLVLGVCRRVLGDANDAADAFQATFLVLARKAASIVPRSRVGPWLFGVARRTALKARSLAARRRHAEREAARVRPLTMPPVDLGRDLRPLFDEEISHLPEKYRDPLVLCLLEGKSRKEAATLLGWSEGTLSGRLARAKDLLAVTLRRRGVTLAGTALLTALTEVAAAAAVPPTLALATSKTALVGTLSNPIVILTEEVMKVMVMSKLKAIVGTLVLVTGIGWGMAAVAWQSGPSPQPAPPVEAKSHGETTAPPAQKKQANPGDYVIEPPDLLLVRYASTDGADPVKIDGQRLVRPDGTIALGQLGSVVVSGKTLTEGRSAIAKHLARRLDEFDPSKLTVEVVASNSKVFYVIVESADGDQVLRCPCTGNETVLDALATARAALIGLGQKQVCIQRVTDGGKGSQELAVDWEAITKRGDAATNYQLLPGDRIRIKKPMPKKSVDISIQELEAIVKAIRQAGSDEERQRIIKDLDAITKRLHDQLNK